MANVRKARWIAILGLVVLLGSGCSLTKSAKESPSIDAPPVDAATMMNASAKPDANATSATQVTLYFKDEKGYVSPITMNVPNNNLGIARKSLEYMVADGPAAPLLPKGFTALLPKGTQIKGLNIKQDQKLAIVDFSKDFDKYDPKDERKILQAVTWTLTGFDSVDKVQLWVDGKPLKEMPIQHTPLDEPLSRAMGINIELPDGVDIGQTTPVTLYFHNETADHFGYYVPVTRMVKRTDDIAKAAVEQLIKGPNTSKGFTPVMAPTTQLLSVKESDDKSLVTVNLGDQFLGSDHKAPEEALQSVILSLTESTGASKVQVLVGGDSKVSASDNKSYSKPVARPSHINPLKM